MADYYVLKCIRFMNNKKIKNKYFCETFNMNNKRQFLGKTFMMQRDVMFMNVNSI